MKLLARTLGVFALALATLMTAQPSVAQDNSIAAIKQRGKLRVGFATFVPWAMRDKQGNWVGFEIDVSKKFAKDMGVTLDLMPTAWDGIIPSLIAGKFDVIIGGLTVTPPRQEQIDFTEPYSHSGLGVAANKELASKLKWPDDYNSAKVTFACRRGATPCQYIEKTFPKATLRQFDDQGTGYQEVINGNAYAFIGSEPLPTFKVLQNSDKLFHPNTGLLNGGFEGMGIKKGNPEMVKYFNDWISKNQDFLKQRHSYWFETRDWANLVPES
ncbi:MAG: transporter substrate-binding domain-containing protein [Burkholderiaceae bacterium]